MRWAWSVWGRVAACCRYLWERYVSCSAVLAMAVRSMCTAAAVAVAMGISVWVYIDDILVFSKDADEHQRHLELLHELLRKHQLFPCIDKSTFFQS